MKRIANTLLLAMLCAVVSHAQNVSAYAFANGVNGIAFDSIKVHRYMPKDDGYRVFLTLKRKGTVQKKMGSIMSGGKDKVWLGALGVVDFDKDLKVVNEEVTFLKPDGAFKQFNLLDGEGRTVVDYKVLGTQDDCVGSNLDFYEKYPELREKEETPELARPQQYYDNSLSYAGFASKIKAFEYELHTLKSEDEQSEKGLFEQLMGSSSAKYDKERKTVEMEDYRGSEKKNYWMKFSAPVSDPVTGLVHAHHARMVMGEKNGRSNLFWQEAVTFDKDGKELERTEISFEKPHELVLRGVFYDETAGSSLFGVDGMVHVYTQLYGMGYKKLNPEPNKKALKYFEWDANGKLVSSIDFEMPVEGVKIRRAFKNGNGVTLLGTSYKPAAVYTFHFVDGKLTDTKTHDAGSDLAKNLGFSPSELGGLTWKYLSAYPQPDGSKIFVYLMDREVKEGTTTTVSSKGYTLFRLGKDGQLTHTQGIKRSEKGDPKYKIYFEPYEAGNGKYAAVFRDPQLGGSQSVNLLEIDGATLAMKKIHDLDNARELDSKSMPAANSIFFFSKNAEKGQYELVRVGL